MPTLLIFVFSSLRSRFPRTCTVDAAPAVMSSTSTTTAVDPERAKESNTAMILGVTGTFHAFALLFVAMRTYTRAVIVKTIGIDDYMMIMSAV